MVALGSDSHGQCSGAVTALQAAGVAVIPQSDVLLIPSSSSSSVHSSPSVGGVVFSVTCAKPLLPVVASDAAKNASDGVPTELAPRILKLAVGLRHSAALTVDGRLFTWGDNRHGQVLACGASTSSSSWRPSNAPLVDVACGAKYTVLIDALGVVYRLGAPFDAQTKGVPVLVEGFPANVRWQRVSKSNHYCIIYRMLFLHTNNGGSGLCTLYLYLTCVFMWCIF